MAAEVVARHLVVEALLDVVQVSAEEPVRRVRVAAERALVRLSEADA